MTQMNISDVCMLRNFQGRNILVFVEILLAALQTHYKLGDYINER